MYLHDEEKPDSRFLEAWREWAERKPCRSPQQAAAQVRLRLERPAPGRPGWLYAATAAALICLSISSIYLWMDGVPPLPSATPLARQQAPLGEGEVLMWLDDKTPLYMNFQSPGGFRVR